MISNYARYIRNRDYKIKFINEFLRNSSCHSFYRKSESTFSAYSRSFGAMGMAYFFERRFEEAAASLLLAIQHDPGFPIPYRLLVACYAHMGRLEEAQGIVERLRALTPIVVPSLSQFRDPEHRELLLSGLRLATGEAI
jgi:tetratricopeptide (TPR) repeat protein